MFHNQPTPHVSSRCERERKTKKAVNTRRNEAKGKQNEKRRSPAIHFPDSLSQAKIKTKKKVGETVQVGSRCGKALTATIFSLNCSLCANLKSKKKYHSLSPTIVFNCIGGVKNHFYFTFCLKAHPPPPSLHVLRSSLKNNKKISFELLFDTLNRNAAKNLSANRTRRKQNKLPSLPSPPLSPPSRNQGCRSTRQFLELFCAMDD